MKRKEIYKKNKNKINRKHKLVHISVFCDSKRKFIHTAKKKKKKYMYILFPLLCCKPQLSQYLISVGMLQL